MLVHIPTRKVYDTTVSAIRDMGNTAYNRARRHGELLFIKQEEVISL